jgi:hypothetical protein
VNLRCHRFGHHGVDGCALWRQLCSRERRSSVERYDSRDSVPSSRHARRHRVLDQSACENVFPHMKGEEKA